MQDTSAIYKEIVASQDFYTETKAVIGSAQIEYNEDVLVSVRTKRKTFRSNVPEVGCCVCGELDLEMFYPPDNIEKMAQINIYIRLVSKNSELVSEWIPQGVYFIDTREKTKNQDDLPLLTIHAYDSMLKAERPYGDTSLSFPTDDLTLVSDIASQMGVVIDSRCVEYINMGYEVQYPAQYTMREMLGFIGSMYGGNWIINDYGELQFIPIWGLPVETDLLIDELGDRLVFGEPPEEETRILL